MKTVGSDKKPVSDLTDLHVCGDKHGRFMWNAPAVVNKAVTKMLTESLKSRHQSFLFFLQLPQRAHSQLIHALKSVFYDRPLL